MGEQRFENPQTVNLQSVLSASAAVHQLLADRESEREGERGTQHGMVRRGVDANQRLCVKQRECVRNMAIMIFSVL